MAHAYAYTAAGVDAADSHASFDCGSGDFGRRLASNRMMASIERSICNDTHVTCIVWCPTSAPFERDQHPADYTTGENPSFPRPL